MLKILQQERSYKKMNQSFWRLPTNKSLRETNISPQGLEAVETLAEVLSQIKTKRRNVKTGVRRRLDAEDVSTGFEDVSTGFTDIKSASEKVSSGGEQHASLAEIARIQAEDEAKNARREELKRQDALVAKRLQEELELSEAQKKRMAQVFAKEITEKMYLRADLISGEWVFITEEKTFVDQKKLAQIKKLTDEELKVKFEYLMRSMEIFMPMDTEKKNRKRTGEELQTESSKKLKSDTGEDVSVPKEKLESAKYGTEEDVEAYMEERVDDPSCGISYIITRGDSWDLWLVSRERNTREIFSRERKCFLL
ncbi:hypothetical protein Tco_0488393 [Tanacetum coccineum]